jgi:hypothetical protein
LRMSLACISRTSGTHAEMRRTTASSLTISLLLEAESHAGRVHRQFVP